MIRPRTAPEADPERLGPDWAASATTLFHSSQASQRPCQRWLTAPQFWQTYWVLGRAIDPASNLDSVRLAYPEHENKT
jgi:hypothetical protein